MLTVVILLQGRAGQPGEDGVPGVPGSRGIPGKDVRTIPGNKHVLYIYYMYLYVLLYYLKFEGHVGPDRKLFW